MPRSACTGANEPRLGVPNITILRNKRYLRETAQRLIRRGIIPQEDGWNGWLGRYQKALREAAMTLDDHNRTNEAKRDRSRDHGR